MEEVAQDTNAQPAWILQTRNILVVLELWQGRQGSLTGVSPVFALYSAEGSREEKEPIGMALPACLPKPPSCSVN